MNVRICFGVSVWIITFNFRNRLFVRQLKGLNNARIYPVVKLINISIFNVVELRDSFSGCGFVEPEASDTNPGELPSMVSPPSK